jgi:hypothetical protein
MTELHPDMHADYESMCSAFGPLDRWTFYDGYLLFECWKSWTPQAPQPEVERAMVT